MPEGGGSENAGPWGFMAREGTESVWLRGRGKAAPASVKGARTRGRPACGRHDLPSRQGGWLFKCSKYVESSCRHAKRGSEHVCHLQQHTVEQFDEET